MRSTNAANQSSRAFFSLDAMLALAIAIFASASFAALLSSAASFAFSQSQQASSEALALSFSSYLLEQCSEKPPYQSPDAYAKANEVNLGCLRSISLQEVLATSKKSFASASLSDAEGELLHSEFGEKVREVFCARRLVAASGKIARLEACLS